MSIADDLARLDDMRVRGALSEEEFATAKARLLGSSAAAGDVPLADAVNRLRRSRADRWVAGVCGGIAVATGAQAWVWRLIVVTLAFFGGTGVLLYLLLWIFVPEDA